MAARAYWLISVPNEKKAEQQTQQQLYSRTQALADMWQFPVPMLKVGTIDSLVALSDELAKIDTFADATVKKIERSMVEVWKQDKEQRVKEAEARNEAVSAHGEHQLPELTVQDKIPEKYVEEFKWEEYRYQKKKSIQQLADGILKDVSKADEELKQQLVEYNEVRSNLMAIERKETGSLLTKSLGPYVKKRDIVETDHLTTLFVVVPKAKETDFLSQYEIMEDVYAEKEAERRREREARQKQKTEQPDAKQDDDDELKGRDSKSDNGAVLLNKRVRIVVPRSAKKLVAPGSEEDDEFCLYRVFVMTIGADVFRTICRDYRYAVRTFKFDPEGDKQEMEKRATMERQKSRLYAHLLVWCKTIYAEVFAAWMHIKAMRLFVEAVLRYGLSPQGNIDFTAALLKPKKGSEKKLRALLQEMYGKLAGDAQITELPDSSEPDMSGFGADFYPYVYLPISIVE